MCECVCVCVCVFPTAPQNDLIFKISQCKTRFGERAFLNDPDEDSNEDILFIYSGHLSIILNILLKRMIRIDPSLAAIDSHLINTVSPSRNLIFSKQKRLRIVKYL